MSATSSHPLNRADLKLLLDVARDAIHGLFTSQPSLPPDLDLYDDNLTRPGASFVTLQVDGMLQGCIGSISAHSPLVLDVYNNTCASARRDRRFSPLNEAQLDLLTVEISVLTEPKVLAVDDESALLAYLSDHKPGVILSEHTAVHHRQAVFLPQVWEQLPDPYEFIHHLMLKGGWEESGWSSAIVVKTFRVECVKGKYTE
jgi:AmmeMemoRadiSam system protein A